MHKIVFAAISPHPPLLLPETGSSKDKAMVAKTLGSLKNLRKEFILADPDLVIISSPHENWGFDVPLFFLADKFQGKIERYFIGSEPPDFYFEEGKKLHESVVKNKFSKIAFIASGDLSHCLKKDGPYGFCPDGPKFDKSLIDSLKSGKINNILKLDDNFPEAGECGLRSFSFLLGFLQAYSDETGLKWLCRILSYESPFGVGYLAAKFNFI